MALSLFVFVVFGWMDEHTGANSGLGIRDAGAIAFIVIWCDNQRQWKKAWKAMKRKEVAA